MKSSIKFKFLNLVTFPYSIAIGNSVSMRIKFLNITENEVGYYHPYHHYHTV